MQVYIKTEDVSVHSTSSLNDDDPPVHTAKQGSVYVLVCAFFVAGVQAELPPDTVGRLYLRPQNTSGNPHVTGVWTKQGTGSSTTYTFVAHLVGSLLDTAMLADSNGSIDYDAEIEWVDPASPNTVNKTVGHTLTVKRAVGTASASVTLPVRTARTIEVANNHAQLTALGYHAYESLQAAVDAALLLTPTESSPVVIRCHRVNDDGISTASLTGIRIVGLGSRMTTIGSIAITGGGNQWANIADCTITTFIFGAEAPGTFNLATDSVLVSQLVSPAKSINIEGSGMIVSLNTDGGGENYSEENAGHIVLSGQVFVNAVSANGDEDGSFAGNGGDLTIQGWCKVGSYVATGAETGTFTDNSLW